VVSNALAVLASIAHGQQAGIACAVLAIVLIVSG